MPARSKSRRQPGRPPGHGLLPPQPDEPINATALYTYEAAAAHLQLSVRTVRNMVYDGRIGHVALNQTAWRIQGRQLLDYIDRHVRGPRR